MDEVREAPASDVITHMYTLDDTPGSAIIPTDTMTVQFKPDVGPDARADILGEHGLEVVEDIDFLSHGYTVRLTDASTENPLKIAAKLQARDDIEAAEPAWIDRQGAKDRLDLSGGRANRRCSEGSPRESARNHSDRLAVDPHHAGHPSATAPGASQATWMASR